MKISEVTIDHLMTHAREYNTDSETMNTFESILAAGKAYIKSYTGLTAQEMDEREELTIALKVLAVDMYDNRTMIVEKNTPNLTVKTILDMHARNLL